MANKVGRPKKQPISTKIKDALDVAQEEIDRLMPDDVQEALVPAVVSPVIDVPPPKLAKDAKEDYDLARTLLHSLLVKGGDILEGITELAREGEAPRAYEVAGTVLKTLIEGTRELMAIHKDIRDIDKKTSSADKEDNSTNVSVKHAENVNHNVVIEATTMDILDTFAEIQRKNKEKKEKGE